MTGTFLIGSGGHLTLGEQGGEVAGSTYPIWVLQRLTYEIAHQTNGE